MITLEATSLDLGKKPTREETELTDTHQIKASLNQKEFKIAQVCPRYHPYIGGVETHVKEISERLAKNIKVEVLTTDPRGDLPPYEEVNGVVVRRFKSWAPNESYYFSMDLPRFLNNNAGEYEIIHAHSYHAFPALYASRNRGKTTFIFTPHYHGEGHTLLRSLLHIPYQIFGAGIFRNAEKTIAVSEYEKKLILENFNINENKIEVIPNGINKTEFKDLKKTENKNRTILSVGRLEEYKGMQYLIKALPTLDEDIQLEIVGKGPYEKKLLNLINDLKLINRVKIVSGIRREDLLQKYVDADLFALLSTSEAYGITVAEALAAGTPCLVAKKSALTEWVDNRNCFGLDFPINIQQLSTLIESTIGKKAINIALLDWEDVSQRIFNVYEAARGSI